MRRIASVVLVLLCLNVACPTAIGQSPIKSLTYPPEFSAEQILNGNLPRPASPPALPVNFDDSGFAKDRVFHVIAPGVQPRILFGLQDLPGIRERFVTAQSGRQMLGFAHKQLADGIDKPGTWGNLLYHRLLDGDIAGFGMLYEAGEQSVVSSNASVNGAMQPATKWLHRDPFAMAIEIKAFVCLVNNNTEDGTRVGKAIASFATYCKPRIEKAAADPLGDNWWRSMRADVDGWPNLPYAYYLAGNPLMWVEDSWFVRQPNNPVQYAFRSAGLVRGAHPYAIVVDDIRKDFATPDYKWLMQLQDDLIVKEQNVHDGMHDIILAETQGNRRLLVRVFDSTEASSSAVTEHVCYGYQTTGKTRKYCVSSARNLLDGNSAQCGGYRDWSCCQ